MGRYARVDIDLSQIDDDELIDELRDRYLDQYDQLELLKMISYDDARKHELIMKVIHKYNLSELEIMFQEKFERIEVSKEQLSLPLE